MVGVINPNGSQTLDGQIRAARLADFQAAPGEAIPSEASTTLAVPPAASSHHDSAPVARHPPDLSGAGIAGIVLGGIAFLTLCATVFFFAARKARQRNQQITTPVTEAWYPSMSSSPFS